MNTIGYKKRFGWYCRIFGAVTALTLLFFFLDPSGVLGRVLRYALYFVFAIFIIGKSEKEEKPRLKKGYYPFAISLFMSLAIFLSYLLRVKTSFALTPYSFLFLCVLAPVSEEFFFRKAIMYKDKSLFACFMSSLVFSLFHTPDAFFTSLLLGFVLAYLYSVSHSLTLTVLCHILNNLVAFLLPIFDARPILLFISLTYSIIYIIKNKDNTNEPRQ